MSKAISSGFPCHVRVTSTRPTATSHHDVVAWTVDEEFTKPIAWFIYNGELVSFPDVVGDFWAYDGTLVAGPAPERKA